MIEAAAWGLLAGSGVLAGAVLACRVDLPPRSIGIVTALGTGALLGAVGFELLPRAAAGAGVAVGGAAFLVGAVVFTMVDRVVDRLGGGRRKRSRPVAGLGRRAGFAILAGTLLDSVPESLALGMGLFSDGRASLVLLVGILLSNLPEGLSGSVGLLRAGFGVTPVLATWAAVWLAGGAAAAAGFVMAADVGPAAEGAILAFAGGAVLAMLVDTMIPEASAEGGRAVGLAAATGLAASWLLSRLG